MQSIATSAGYMTILIGAIIGLVIEIANQRTQGRFPISGVGLGLAFVLNLLETVVLK